MRKLPELSEEIIRKHLDYCQEKLLPKLKELQKQHPKQKALKSCISDFDNLMISKDLALLKEEHKALIDCENKRLRGICKEIATIFYNAYTNFSKGTTKWGRHHLFSSLNVMTCPYCDRQYITNYVVERETKKKEKDPRTTADADHFYPKSKYPFLSLNIYNLIPSCQICNSRLKGDKELQHSSSPYEKAFQEEIGFRIKMKEDIPNKVIPSAATDFTVAVNINGKSAEEYLNTFKIQEVYETSHNAYVKNMIECFESHSETYLNQLESLLVVGENKETKRKYIQEILKEMLKYPYTHKIENEEPLGKLTKDILQSYGILEEDE